MRDLEDHSAADTAVPAHAGRGCCCEPAGLARRHLHGSGRISEILPSCLGVEGAVEYEATRGSVVGQAACTGIAGPDAFTGGGGREEGTTGSCRPSRTGSGVAVHGGEFGVPPRPDFALGLIAMGSVVEVPEDVEGSCRRITEISFGSRPPVVMDLDEAVPSKAAEDRRGVACTDSEESRGGIDRERRVLAEGGVDPAGEVSESLAREQIMPLVGEFVLEDIDEFGAMGEELSGGGGVIE